MDDLEFEFKMQADAVARVLNLLGENKYSFNDVIHILARAEQKAQFICGFVNLDNDEAFKVGLEERLLTRNVIIKNADKTLSLTQNGKERDVPLPEQIEMNMGGIAQLW